MLLALSLTAAAAGADTRAEELFQSGRKAMKSADWATALPLLSESYKLEPAPGTLLNAAECEMHLGLIATALDHFKQVERTFAADDKRRQVTSERIRVLQTRAPRLVVKIADGSPKGTDVLRGQARIEPEVPTLVDPGTVALTVTAPGRRERTLSVDMKEGEVRTVVAEPGSPNEAPSAGSTPVGKPPPPHGQGGSGRRTIGLVVGGVGLASLGVGAVTGIMALGKASTVKEHCDGDLACDQQGIDAGAAGNTLALVSSITVIAGIVGIGAGAFLFVTSKNGPPSVAVVPVFTREGGGVALTRSF